MASLLDWLRLNLKIGALSFGSAGRILLYQDAVVEKNRWLSQEEFQEIFTIAQLLPGPNLVNLAVYLGFRFAGLAGAILGLLLLAVPGALLAVAFVFVLGLKHSALDTFLIGFSIGSIVLFVALVLRMMSGLHGSIGFTASRLKIALRYLLLLFVALLSGYAVPIGWILLIGGVLGIGLEFAIP